MRILRRTLNILTAIIAALFSIKAFAVIIEYGKAICNIEKQVGIAQTCEMWLKFDFNSFISLYIVFVVITIIILVIACWHECRHKIEIHGNQCVLECNECAYERLK